MNSFNFKNRNLISGPHLLGTLLIIAGLFALVSPALLANGSSLERTFTVGIGAIIVGLLIITSHNGALIDFTQNRFKEYQSVLGYKFGEWTTLPEIVKVKVISNSYISSNTPNGISPTLSGNVMEFKILIYSKHSIPVLSFIYSNEDRAVKYARDLAFNLNAELVLNIQGKK